MHIDIFSEMQFPKPWPDHLEKVVIGNTIDQAALADELGYGCWWQVEHHGSVEFSYSATPELMLTALATSTKNIRLGQAGVLTPHQINHPLRIAERAAFIDTVSNGRFEMGLARSGGGEWTTFEVDGETTGTELAEVAKLLPQMWTQETFSADNGFVKIPERHLTLKPQQRPHPAMWLTASSLDSFFNAGKLGLGVIGVTLLVPPTTLSELLDSFDRGRAEVTPVSQVDNDQKGVFTFVHCTETREQAIESRAAEAAMWYVNQFPKTFGVQRSVWIDMIRGDGPSGRAVKTVDDPMGNIDPNDPVPLIRVLNRQALGMEVDPEEAYELISGIDTMLIGDIDTLVKKADAFKNIGVDRLLSLQQFGTLSHEQAMNSIRLTGEHLIPAVG